MGALGGCGASQEGVALPTTPLDAPTPAVAEGVSWGATEVQGDVSASRALVLLHGYGGSGEGMAPVGASLARDDIFVVMPDGAMRQGEGYAWFDMAGLRLEGDFSRAEPPGLEEAAARVEEILQKLEQSGFARECMVLAGYSQGAVVAADAALRSTDALAGVGFFSSVLVAQERWQQRWNETSFFVAHGRSDSQVSFAFGEQLRDVLAGAGVSHEFHAFDGGHTMDPAVVERFQAFVNARTARCRR